MAGYASKVNDDIERWVAGGLIDRATAARLSADIEKRVGKGFTFGGVLAVMAAILVGAAVLLFVAANWEEFPRLLRVGALFGLIVVGYVGGAALKARGHEAFGEGLYLIGCAAFGGSIALIGQMYHMTGDERQAILVWCAGTSIAAAALRSSVLTIASVLLAVTWLLIGIGFFSSDAPDWRYLPLAGLIWGVSFWSDSVAARHLLLLSLIVFGVLLGTGGSFLGSDSRMVSVGAAMAIISAAVFLGHYFAPDSVERFTRLGGPYPAHPLLGFLTGIGMIQAQVGDQFFPMLVTSLVAFAGIVAALLLRGRESRLMRWLAYIAFTIELIILYTVTLGTMMETSALFLFSGVALAIVAWLIMRIEKRIAADGASA